MITASEVSKKPGTVQRLTNGRLSLGLRGRQIRQYQIRAPTGNPPPTHAELRPSAPASSACTRRAPAALCPHSKRRGRESVGAGWSRYDRSSP